MIGDNMPALKSLTKEMKEALGNSGLVKDYAKLLEKKELIDDDDAVKYVKAVVTRYKSIKATHPPKEEYQAKRKAILLQLKPFIAELSIASFSKPGDVILLLQDAGFERESITKIVKHMEQPGADGDEFCCFLTSIATSDTSLICNDDHDHHHHHHDHHGGYYRGYC